MLPRLQGLRETVGEFSSLSIPTLDPPNPFSELPLEEANRRHQEREAALTTYNSLFRDYAIKYGHFQRVALPFLLLVSALVVASAFQFPLRYEYRAGAAVGILSLLGFLTAYLRPLVAPMPGELVSIDYIGEHFTHLLYQSVLDVMDMQVHWMGPEEENGIFRFQIVTRLWITGFKFLFTLSDPPQEHVYFASYGSVGERTKFTHFLDPNNQLFACSLGDCDYRQMLEPRPDLDIHLWLFVPIPKSWRPVNIQRPSLLHSVLVEERPGGGGKAFVVTPPHVSLRALDRHVSFNRIQRSWGGESWKIGTDAISAAVLREFVSELPSTSAIVTVKYPTGRRLNRPAESNPTPKATDKSVRPTRAAL